MSPRRDHAARDDEPPVLDLGVLHRRLQRRQEEDRRRRLRRERLIGGALGLAAAAGIAFGVHALTADGEGAARSPAEGGEGAEAGPVRVDVGPPPAEPAAPPMTGGSAADSASATPGGSLGDGRGEPAQGGRVEQATPGTPAGGAPVVWVQAGHADPREPGYRAQTGASSGPFGSEVGFTTRLASRVVARLRAAGVDARQTPGRVTPLGARGAAFVSLHHDTPDGAAALGHAITGAGENYYRGEGFGDPSPRPYRDSAPHRPATTVSPAVERRSRSLARAIDRRFRPIYTAANGARGRYAGVQSRESNPRLMRFYGFYRTRADARVIVEAGAGGTDDAFLARTDLIARAVSRGVLDHLRARALVPR